MPKPNRVQIIKYGPPPPELPVFGKVKPEEVSFIGRTNYVASLEEKKFIFGIKRVDRRRHLYIIGKSGVGKTKLLELMLRQDITYDHGLCLIDPHGDVIEAMLDGDYGYEPNSQEGYVPTEAIPGTREKLGVMEGRADRGNPSVFHPKDVFRRETMTRLDEIREAVEDGMRKT